MEDNDVLQNDCSNASITNMLLSRHKYLYRGVDCRYIDSNESDHISNSSHPYSGELENRSTSTSVEIGDGVQLQTDVADYILETATCSSTSLPVVFIGVLLVTGIDCSVLSVDKMRKKQYVVSFKSYLIRNRVCEVSVRYTGEYFLLVKQFHKCLS